MSKAILLLSSLLVFSGAFSHDGKSAKKVQTMDLIGSQGLKGDCSGLNWCGTGLTCNDDKTCVYYAVPKAACGSSAGGIDCVDGYWCREGIGSGLTCSSGKEGEACSNLGESCNGDLSCLSRGYCGKNAGPKEACGSSAGNVDCEAGYSCSTGIGNGKTCSSGKEGEACSNFGRSCNDGLSCLSKGYCVKNAGPGELCGDAAGGLDCGTDYYCTYGLAKGETCSTGRQGEACDLMGQGRRCNDGLACFEKDGSAACTPVAGPKEACNLYSYNSDCVDGYSCSTGIGDGGTCSSGKAGEACSNSGESCNDGLSCLSRGYCGTNAGPGELCGSSAGTVDCGTGYWCTSGLSKGMTCSSGSEGEACLATATGVSESCNDGLSCTNVEGKGPGVCIKNAGPKEACGSSAGGVDCGTGYWCREGIGSGLTCSSGKEGEACSNLGKSCNDGLSCLSKGYCGKNAGPGELCGDAAGGVDCGTDYYCTYGLAKGETCSSGRQGEACVNGKMSCNDGLACFEKDGSAACTPVAGPKEACNLYSYNSDCVDGYSCSTGIGDGGTCSSGKAGEACSNGGESCNDGLSCLSLGYCGKKAGPGELCGSSAGGVDCLGAFTYCTEGLPQGMTCSSGQIGEACGGGSRMFRIRACDQSLGLDSCKNDICVQGIVYGGGV